MGGRKEGFQLKQSWSLGLFVRQSGCWKGVKGEGKRRERKGYNGNSQRGGYWTFHLSWTRTRKEDKKKRKRKIPSLSKFWYCFTNGKKRGKGERQCPIFWIPLVFVINGRKHRRGGRGEGGEGGLGVLQSSYHQQAQEKEEEKKEEKGALAPKTIGGGGFSPSCKGVGWKQQGRGKKKKGGRPKWFPPFEWGGLDLSPLVQHSWKREGGEREKNQSLESQCLQANPEILATANPKKTPHYATHKTGGKKEKKRMRRKKGKKSQIFCFFLKGKGGREGFSFEECLFWKLSWRLRGKPCLDRVVEQCLGEGNVWGGGGGGGEKREKKSWRAHDQLQMSVLLPFRLTQRGGRGGGGGKRYSTTTKREGVNSHIYQHHIVKVVSRKAKGQGSKGGKKRRKTKEKFFPSKKTLFRHQFNAAYRKCQGKGKEKGKKKKKKKKSCRLDHERKAQWSMLAFLRGEEEGGREKKKEGKGREFGLHDWVHLGLCYPFLTHHPQKKEREKRKKEGKHGQNMPTSWGSAWELHLLLQPTTYNEGEKEKKKGERRGIVLM